MKIGKKGFIGPEQCVDEKGHDFEEKEMRDGGVWIKVLVCKKCGYY